MSKIVKIKPKNGEEQTYYDVEIEGDELQYFRLTLYQAGKIVAQFDKASLERWEVVQTSG